MDVWKSVLTVLVVSEGFPRPGDEWEFHPTRKWRFDLAWPELKVAFEKEGMAPKGGKSRHTQPVGYGNDCAKYNAAQLLGWIVIRGTSRQIQSGESGTDLLAALRLRSGGGN